MEAQSVRDMKRSLFVWALLAGMAVPALAGKPLVTRMVTVAEVRQVLAANHDLPDAKLAKLIVDMKLTERLATHPSQPSVTNFPDLRRSWRCSH